MRANGAGLIAGHSAHVFHGVHDRILFDLGDFDYARDAWLHNDLGLLLFVTVAHGRPIELEAVPIALDYCFTRLADADEAAWIHQRFRRACAALGIRVDVRGSRLLPSLDDKT